MLKILQARLQQYMKHELPDVQAGFRKGRGTRDQIANIHWIIKKAREFQKSIYFCFIDYAKGFGIVNKAEIDALLTMPKPLTVWITRNCGNSERDGNTRPPELPFEKSVCKSGSNS